MFSTALIVIIILLLIFFYVSVRVLRVEAAGAK